MRHRNWQDNGDITENKTDSSFLWQLGQISEEAFGWKNCDLRCLVSERKNNKKLPYTISSNEHGFNGLLKSVLIFKEELFLSICAFRITEVEHVNFAVYQHSARLRC